MDFFARNFSTRLLLRIVLLLAILFLAGCVASRPNRVSAPRAAPSGAPSLPQAKDELIRYYESGQRDAEIIGIASEALAWVKQSAQTVQKPIVIFDLDDTLLSNYERLKARDFAFAGPLGGDGDRAALAVGLVTDMTQQLPPIRPVLDLYSAIREQGVGIFILSERPETLRATTQKNLYESGFAGWAKLLLPPKSQSDSHKSVAERKQLVRKALEKQGLNIIAVIGDQESDFSGGSAGKTFLLPNPMYVVQ